MQTIEVNTRLKAKRIIEQLKKQGRRAWYEQFCGLDGMNPSFYYVIFYREV